MINAKVNTKTTAKTKEFKYNQNLEEKASFISKTLFLWTNKVIKQGNKKQFDGI